MWCGVAASCPDPLPSPTLSPRPRSPHTHPRRQHFKLCDLITPFPMNANNPWPPPPPPSPLAMGRAGLPLLDELYFWPPNTDPALARAVLARNFSAISSGVRGAVGGRSGRETEEGAGRRGERGLLWSPFLIEKPETRRRITRHVTVVQPGGVKGQGGPWKEGPGGCNRSRRAREAAVWRGGGRRRGGRLTIWGRRRQRRALAMPLIALRHCMVHGRHVCPEASHPGGRARLPHPGTGGPHPILSLVSGK